MKRYKVIVRRCTYELLEVIADNKDQARELALKNQGALAFKADDQIDFIAVTEAIEGETI